MISRRQAVGTSSLAVLCLVSGTTFAAGVNKGPAVNLPQELGERTEKPKALSEQSRDADNMVEWQQLVKEQMARQREKTFEHLKEQLRLSDQEWSVVKPRLHVVYDLVRPQPPMPGRNEPPKTEVEQIRQALRELLRDEKAPADQIKAGLMALRAAQERALQELSKARQNLRQIMNLRQEAVLVLNGLLD